MEYEEILRRLESLANPEAVAGMARFGIASSKAYGVSVPNLRKIAREAGSDHCLAQRLWKRDRRETRILAGMVDDPGLVSEEQMERWVKDFRDWEVCDQCCMNLFHKTAFAYEKCLEWSGREEEFVERAGFALMARLAVSDKVASDAQFEAFLPTVKREAADGRNYVKKAVNWALRQIGKRNINLNRSAIRTAKEIQAMDSPSAKWVASDALRELTSEAVQERLRGGKAR